MTVSFTQFGAKDLTTLSNKTVVKNYCSSVSTAKVGGQNGVVLFKNLTLLSCIYVSLSRKIVNF